MSYTSNNFSTNAQVILDKFKITGVTPTSKCLDLNSKDITDNQLAILLAEMPQLTTLELYYNTQITDRSMEEIGKLSALTELNLDVTSVTDAGMEALSRIPSLTSLKLRHTKVSDVGMEALSSLPSLTMLNVLFTSVTYAKSKEMDAFCQTNKERIAKEEPAPTTNPTPNLSSADQEQAAELGDSKLTKHAEQVKEATRGIRDKLKPFQRPPEDQLGRDTEVRGR